MKKNTFVWLGGLLVALLVIGAFGATAASAQGAESALYHGRGPGGGHGLRLGQAELDAAAKALGMTTDELSAALKDGKTLQDLANAAGVDIETVQSAIQAAHRIELRERIQQAVTDGTISQEKADWLLEGLDKGFLDGPGFGLGFGGGGHWFGIEPLVKPTQQSTP